MGITLKKGDIIVFKAEGDLLSKTIALLTNSDVSHAAMVYSDEHIVEQGAWGIGVNRFKIAGEREAYVMRLESERDFAPLISAADKYINAHIPYDYIGVIMLAGLLVTKKILPTNKLTSALITILSFACLAIDQLIQKAFFRFKERAMICSQLVYQIYYDCGKNYQIQVKSPLSSFYQTDAFAESYICLAEMAEELPAQDNTSFHASETVSLSVSELTLEQDLEKLYIALSESKAIAENLYTGSFQLASSDELQNAAYYAAEFLKKIKYILSLSGSNLPMDSLLVTPADFVYHSSNLKKEGIIKLVKIPAKKI